MEKSGYEWCRRVQRVYVSMGSRSDWLTVGERQQTTVKHRSSQKEEKAKGSFDIWNL